jgi:hypothetical protein
MPFDLNQYLEAATRASGLARKVLFAMLTASVLLVAATLNSMQADWGRQRLNELQHPHDLYVDHLVGAINSADDQKLEATAQIPPSPKIGNKTDENVHREKRYDALYNAYVHSYVDNTFFVHVPLFGFAFDINNLGLLGGVALVILLMLFRYSLLRELSNVQVSFRRAHAHGTTGGDARAFYELLAMQQVLTVPDDVFSKNNSRLRKLPALLFFAPLAAFSTVFVHDLLTYWIGGLLGARSHALSVFAIEAVWFVVILYATVDVFLLHRKIDQAWDQELAQIQQDGGSVPAS